MINIGLDISKDFHEVHILKGQRSISSFRIDNAKEGFEELERRIRVYPREEVKVAMESTGHYWKPIATYLRKRGYDVELINSFHVANFKEIEDNTPNKNDRKDSRIIAKLSSYGKGLYANLSDGEKYSCIKNVYDARRRAVNDEVRHKTVIRTLIERHFPEYEKFFSNLWIKTSIALLMEIGLEGFEDKREEEIGKVIRKASRGRFKEDTGRKLKELFKNSIGLREGIKEASDELKYRDGMIIADIQ
ncbi:MAG: IS110 family transposase [Brevinematia bacterium]